MSRLPKVHVGQSSAVSRDLGQPIVVISSIAMRTLYLRMHRLAVLHVDDANVLMAHLTVILRLVDGDYVVAAGVMRTARA
jgi:hypothetical protein